MSLPSSEKWNYKNISSFCTSLFHHCYFCSIVCKKCLNKINKKYLLQRTVTTVKRTTFSRAAETTALLSWQRPGMVGCGSGHVCVKISAMLVANQMFCHKSTGVVLASGHVTYVFLTENLIRLVPARENSRRIWKPATSVCKVCAARCDAVLCATMML